MHEIHPPTPPESHETLPAPSVPQMVYDLWRFCPDGEDYTNPDRIEFADRMAEQYGKDFFRDGADIGFEGNGYPDPVRAARAQAEAAQERGEEPPMTPERMAHDVYFYEVERHKTDVRYVFPSFEERYGYPDPRPKLPEDARPDNSGAQS